MNDTMFYVLDLFLLLATSTHALRFRNVCVKDDPIVTVYGITLSACEETCGTISACQNFIFTRRSFRCSLYGSVANSEECTGSVFVSVPSNMLPGSGLQYCPNMAEDNYTVVLGNMNMVGAKRTIGCLPQYALDGASSSKCLQNGSWLETGSCVRVCAAPAQTAACVYTQVQIVTATETTTLTNPDAGTMHNLDYFVGSIVHVTCADLASVIVDGPAHGTCLQDGTWSAHGICVKTCNSPGHVQKLVYVRLSSRDGQTIDSPANATVGSFLFASGSSVTVECSAGVLVGSATVYCGASGAWGTFPTCQQTTTMRMPCSTSSDCVDTNSECRNSQCWCNRGLSYSPSETACVDECQTYGNTFQEVPGYAIMHYDLPSVIKTNVAECRDYCEGIPTCYCVDFGVYHQKCWINTHLPSQLADSSDFGPLSSFIYLQRDCA